MYIDESLVRHKLTNADGNARTRAKTQSGLTTVLPYPLPFPLSSVLLSSCIINKAVYYSATIELKITLSRKYVDSHDLQLR